MTWQMVYSGTPLQLTPLGPTILSIITMHPASGIFPLGVVLHLSGFWLPFPCCTQDQAREFVFSLEAHFTQRGLCYRV